VPGAGEGQDLVAAGVQLGEAQRGLVGLAAGREEHRPRERLGQQRHELAGEVGDVAREEGAEEVHDPPARLAHRLGDRRVTVAERRAHLAGREVQDPPPVLGGEPAALGVLDEQVGEVAAVADEVAVEAFGERFPPGVAAGATDRFPPLVAAATTDRFLLIVAAATRHRFSLRRARAHCDMSTCLS
jgi:hypothetical protein